MAHIKQIIVPLIRPRQSGSTIPYIFLPLKYVSHMALGIWGAPIKMSISGRSVIPVSYGKKVVQLGRTNLISVWGSHISILFLQGVHPVCNRRGMFWEILSFSHLIFNMGNKLGYYPRVSIAHLSESVLYQASGGRHPCVFVSTYSLYVFLRRFYISCISYIIEPLNPSNVYLRRQSNWAWEWVNKHGVPANENFGLRY